jgi:Double zinc ribbon
MSDVLERFHRALVEEISAQHPEYLDGPFTVAEIYQNLVPYGTHRDRIGVDMNGDYEDALLRMLAGEGEYLLMESEHALRDLRQELRSANPNTGLYREFAAVDVRLNPARVRAVNAHGRRSGPQPQDEPEALSVADLAPDTVTEEPAPKPSSAAGDVPDSCRWCRAELPRRPRLRFCPFCGTDVHVVPCPGCGEELEPDWRFCIACGAEVTG